MNSKSYQVAAVVFMVVLAGACGGGRQASVDPEIDAEIQRVRAIDHHAHPVRVVAKGEPADRGFDALPVDNMEPMSDPLMLRPGVAAVKQAAQAMSASKAQNSPEAVLDQMGIEIMFANRVEMGSSIQPPRFRWVPYADALIFPLDNSKLAARNSDRKSFFALEDVLRQKYMQTLPPTLSEYLAQVVTPTLERHKQGGAVAEKFEAAYLRSLAFDAVDRATAERVYARKSPLDESEYKPLQDFLFRYVAAECGRLGMAVHLHTMAGAGSYFEINGANPLLLESVVNDPSLRKTTFVMVHGGWPFIREIASMLTKPNAWLDISGQALLLTPATLAGNLRDWLSWVPEKVMFGTDAYPYTPELGWEESGWLASRQARQALGIALTAMLRDGEITLDRAKELARMVLRDNARKLYAL